MQAAWGVDPAIFEPSLCQVRLSLSGSDPVPVADQTAKTSVYCHPFLGNRISLWDGSRWRRLSLSSFVSVAVPATTLTPFDVFAYVSAGSVLLETTNWTDGTTRATALASQDGVTVRSGAPTRRYLGTGCTTAVSGQCEDSEIRRFLWNANHRRPTSVSKLVASSWNYGTDTFRQWNDDTANQVELVAGLAGESLLDLSASIGNIEPTSSVSVTAATCSIGHNSLVSAAQLQGFRPSYPWDGSALEANPGTITVLRAALVVRPPVGRRWFPALERAAASVTWNVPQGRLFGQWEC